VQQNPIWISESFTFHIAYQPAYFFVISKYSLVCGKWSEQKCFSSSFLHSAHFTPFLRSFKFPSFLCRIRFLNYTLSQTRPLHLPSSYTRLHDCFAWMGKNESPLFSIKPSTSHIMHIFICRYYIYSCSARLVNTHNLAFPAKIVYMQSLCTRLKSTTWPYSGLFLTEKINMGILCTL